MDPTGTPPPGGVVVGGVVVGGVVVDGVVVDGVVVDGGAVVVELGGFVGLPTIASTAALGALSTPFTVAVTQYR
ncbi:hypothetical protein [Actinokineospora sp.]|uniref:hypothetical protein n=1 Tax=Actinokineospora sp. TaxID=1872133 RepID=UPI004038435A